MWYQLKHCTKRCPDLLPVAQCLKHTALRLLNAAPVSVVYLQSSPLHPPCTSVSLWRSSKVTALTARGYTRLPGTQNTFLVSSESNLEKDVLITVPTERLGSWQMNSFRMGRKWTDKTSECSHKGNVAQSGLGIKKERRTAEPGGWN